MTQPRDALLQLAACLAAGCALGLWYGFLRPLRPRHTLLADSLFMLGVFQGWLYTGFAVCGGDLRLAYTAALFAGVWVFDRTAGRLLRPVFRLFWKGLEGIWGIFTLPFRKTLKFVKKCLHLSKNGLQ